LIHHIYDRGSIKDLVEEASEGLIDANKTIEEIENVNKYLEENDPIKKLTE